MRNSTKNTAIDTSGAEASEVLKALVELGAIEEPTLGPVWYRRDPPVFGGRPARSVHNPELEILEWNPPLWLRELYAIHEGLGLWWQRAQWTRSAILPWERCIPLTAKVRFGEENICYDPADVVLFSADGMGGGWVLQGRDRPRIHRFCGASHKLGAPLSLGAALAQIAEAW